MRNMERDTNTRSSVCCKDSHCVKYARMRLLSDRAFPYEEKIYDSILHDKTQVTKKVVFWNILRSVNFLPLPCLFVF